MNGCGLKSIPEAVKMGVNLSFLSLENNNVVDIQGLEKLTKLRVLNLARNSLKDVHKTTQILAQLQIQTLDIRWGLINKV
jgi:Leucine-rich repeat (LRR) protein